MTGNWFGVRDSLADHGIKIGGKYEGVFYGVLDSNRGQRGFYDRELGFAGDVDFAKLLKSAAPSKASTGFAEVRWRDSRSSSNPNSFVQASSLFQPSNTPVGHPMASADLRSAVHHS